MTKAARPSGSPGREARGPAQLYRSRAPRDETAARSDDSAPLFGLPDAWWPLALSEDIQREPRAVQLGRQRLAVYRTPSGVAHAVEDRCAHRRVPLSLGRVTEDGLLQCGYHGWCYEGAMGRCERIPNLRADERPPGRIRVRAFPVRERDGFVQVRVGGGDSSDPDAAREGDRAAAPSALRALHGGALVRAPLAEVIEAVVANIGAALGLGWLIAAGDEARSPTVTVGQAELTVVRQRDFSGRWRVPTFDALGRRLRHHPATLRTTTRLASGMTWLEADGPVDGSVVRAVVGLTPIGAYRTAVGWRWVLEAGNGWALPRSVLARVPSRTPGHVKRSLERAADLSPGSADDGVLSVRSARAVLEPPPSALGPVAERPSHAGSPQDRPRRIP